MSNRLLYIYGEPGTGKITTARILAARLGWKLLWVHDLDPVCDIVGRHPLPRLLDDVSRAVLRQLMSDGKDIIYVRPSRDIRTVNMVEDVVQVFCYTLRPVRLECGRVTQVARVEGRPPDPKRVSDRNALETYLGARPALPPQPGEMVISTDDLTPGLVAARIERWLKE